MQISLSSKPATGHKTRSRFVWLAAIVGLIATLSYAIIGDWPLGTHFDEPKKAFFVLSGTQDFKHPILLIQLGRLANLFAGFTDADNFIHLGRGLAAAFGGLLVFSTFVLGQMVLSPLTALTVSLAVAICPLVAVHATFYKEDIFLAPLVVLAVAALVWVTERPSGIRSFTLGVVIGLAASAKYIGAILFPLGILVVLICANGKIRERLESVAVVIVAGIATFCAINAPIFWSLSVFEKGFGFEVNHALSGHAGIGLGVSATFGVMHLMNSLWPGLGSGLLIVGLSGLAAPIVNRKLRLQLSIILVVALSWYAVHELAPMKTFADSGRYMVPLAPLIFVSGAAFVETVVHRMSRYQTGLITPLVIAVAAGPAFYDSFRIFEYAKFDPRSIVERLAPELGPGARFTWYASFVPPRAIQAVALGGHDPAPAIIVVTSNLYYGRFLLYGRHTEKASSVDELALRETLVFEKMFEKAYLEISNGNPTYAFLNPVIRIVALDNDNARLAAIAASIMAIEPRFRITHVRPEN